ncbi:MAG: hypothetical protein L6R35_001073 [Caloplaca aegaea]|nr:MAG: hypothetical protein L6R35_001073 [Caloplaca aegaea]
MEIDPQLRDHAPSKSQSYSTLPPSNYPLNPIRLPPPQQHQPPQHPWPPFPDPHLYPPNRPGQHGPNPNQPDHSLYNDATSQQADQSPVDSKRPRACEACRGLKVRCEPDPVKSTCRRCAKAGRSCVVTAPSRKRQKKTDSRVAELERKIDALTASLHATKAQAASESDDESTDGRRSLLNASSHELPTAEYLSQEAQRMADAVNMIQQRPLEDYGEQAERLSHQPITTGERKRRMSQYPEENLDQTGQSSQTRSYRMASPVLHSARKGSEMSYMRPDQPNGNLSSVPSTSPQSTSPAHEYADVIDRKILDAALAAEIFEHYTRKMATHVPLVVVPPDTPAGSVRKHKPTLFLAILSVASGQEHPEIQRILAKEVMRAFADRIVYKGEKSLELIQAMQILTIWYWPEENRDAQTYQLVHMAAVMAIDLGLGRRAKSSREPYHALWKDYPRTKSSAQASDSLESRRAWLGCYLLCANTAMGLKRSNLIRWSTYMDECLDSLSTSSEALPSDSTLLEWVRLQRLADDLGNQISVDESSNIGVSDLKTQYALKAFERQMKEWDRQASKEKESRKFGGACSVLEKVVNVLLGSLTFTFHVVNLYMHEFAMHLDQTLDFSSGSRPTEGKVEHSKVRSQVLTTAHVGALTTCLTSIHGMFDTFLQMTQDEIRTAPVFYFVRVAHASVLLIVMYFAATSPESELGKVISSDDMRVDHYLGKVRELLGAGAESGKCRPARSFYLVLVMFQTWFERKKEGKGSISQEVANSKRHEAQPVDVEKHAHKAEYQRMQLNGDGLPARRSSMAQGGPPAGVEGVDQSRLHVLGEVALGNSGSKGPSMKAGHENWNAYPMGPTASGYGSFDYGTTVVPFGASGYETEMAGYHPGFEQAIGMTFNEGNLSLDDYALYNMMQMPNLFESMAQ